MAFFSKKTWKDRLVEYAGRRKITNVSTMVAQIVDVERAEGIVSEEGNALSAANMNDLEQRVADGFTSVQRTTDTLTQNLQDIMGGKAVIKTLLEKKVIRNTTNNTTMRFTVNVSGIEGYKNFTTNNFGVEPCGYNEESIGATNGANTTNQTAYIDYYDASTGIVTIAVLWGWINTSSWASVFNIYLYRGAII